MCRSSAYTGSVSKQSMQEPTFLILTALAAGAQHGYGIMTDVARIPTAEPGSGQAPCTRRWTG